MSAASNQARWVPKGSPVSLKISTFSREQCLCGGGDFMNSPQGIQYSSRPTLAKTNCGKKGWKQVSRSKIPKKCSSNKNGQCAPTFVFDFVELDPYP